MNGKERENGCRNKNAETEQKKKTIKKRIGEEVGRCVNRDEG